METASHAFLRGYSVQQVKASKKAALINRLLLKIVCLMFKSSIFALWKQIDRKK
jgi:hypothetical protein